VAHRHEARCLEPRVRELARNARQRVRIVSANAQARSCAHATEPRSDRAIVAKIDDDADARHARELAQESDPQIALAHQVEKADAHCDVDAPIDERKPREVTDRERGAHVACSRLTQHRRREIDAYVAEPRSQESAHAAGAARCIEDRPCCRRTCGLQVLERPRQGALLALVARATRARIPARRVSPRIRRIAVDEKLLVEDRIVHAALMVTRFARARNGGLGEAAPTRDAARMFDPATEHAIRAALAAHAGQRRKSADLTPYVAHPVHVALILARLGLPPRVLQAGLLHDVVEDCDGWTIARVEREFGADVASVVAELTEDKSLSWEERKRAQIVGAPRLSRDALAVKSADKLHNLRTMASDLRAAPDRTAFWARFSRGPAFTLGHARELVDALAARCDPRLAAELRAAMLDLEHENAT